MRRDFSSFKPITRTVGRPKDKKKDKSYLDYLMGSEYSKEWKEFYKKVYLRNKVHQDNGSNKLLKTRI